MQGEARGGIVRCGALFYARKFRDKFGSIDSFLQDLCSFQVFPKQNLAIDRTRTSGLIANETSELLRFCGRCWRRVGEIVYKTEVVYKKLVNCL